MGCWNETCGFTNLPISANDEVLWTIIQPTRAEEDRDALYYAYDFYQPILPLYLGSYDDYGGVETGDEVEEAAAAFGDLKKPIYDDNNRYGRQRPCATINGTEYKLESGQWLWMMHRSAYDMLLTMPLRESTVTVGEYERELRAKVSDQLVEKSVWTGKSARSHIISKLGKGSVATIGIYEVKRLLEHGQSFRPPVNEHVYEQLDELFEEVGGKEHQWIEQCLRMLDPLFPLFNLAVALDLIRKPLGPVSGAGSQSWNYSAYEVLGRFITDKATAYRQEWEADQAEWA